MKFGGGGNPEKQMQLGHSQKQQFCLPMFKEGNASGVIPMEDSRETIASRRTQQDVKRKESLHD